MLWRTSTDSADTQCGYREAAAAHLEGQGSSHSTARAVLRSTCNDPMTGALLTSACRMHVSITDGSRGCGCFRPGLQSLLIQLIQPACRHMHMLSSKLRRCRSCPCFLLPKWHEHGLMQKSERNSGA